MKKPYPSFGYRKIRPSPLLGRSFLSLLDFSPAQIRYLLFLSEDLKQRKRFGHRHDLLTGKNIVLIFEKDSTRTRCAFEVASSDLGARTTYLGPSGSHLGSKESVADTARVLGRMYDGIQYRGFGQSRVDELAKHAGVPVWNGLTDEFHPTQVLADLLTMAEHVAKPLNQVRVCFLGDCRYNMANSLMAGAALMGIDIRLCGPAGFLPDPYLTDRCRKLARQSGGWITITDNVAEAVHQADFVYTDVWVSMGEPKDSWDERIKLMQPFQVNAALMAATGNPNTKFLHCLPAFHDRETAVGREFMERHGLEGLEVTNEVFRSPASIVFDQAENRLHTIKAVLVATLYAG
jgi:ornithine carbamoyltransferase